MQVSRARPLFLIKKSIESSLKKEVVSQLVSEEYVGNDYIDITGIRHRLVILSENQTRERMEDIVFNKREDIPKKLRELALEIYTQEVRKYEKIMNIPISHDVKVTTMSSSLGKNYTKKHLITFDKHLIHYSIELIDSVVIHELCHYFYQDHSSKFYKLLYSYCPNYDVCFKKLGQGIRR